MKQGRKSQTEEQLKEKYEGRPSRTPYQIFRRRGLEVPDWALKCQKLYSMNHYYSNIDKMREYKNNWFKEYRNKDTNSEGILLTNIRVRSHKYLVNELGFEKIPGYHIHHCFTYDDEERFVYLPAWLHHRIHRFLKKNGISAKDDHYQLILPMLRESRVAVYLSDNGEIKQIEARL